MLGRSETPFLSGSLACSMMACRTSVIKQKVFIGRGRKLAVVVSCTIGRSSVALFLYSSRTHLSLYLGLDASCLPLLPGLRIHFHHENARIHTFERSIRSRLSQVVMGLSRERRCHGITSTLITDSHAITLPSLPLWVMQGGGTRRGLLLHVPPLGLTDRWMMAWSGFESPKRRHCWSWQSRLRSGIRFARGIMRQLGKYRGKGSSMMVF